MELAGLVIGATVAVIPVYQGIDKLVSTLREMRSHSKELGMLRLQINIHKAKLSNECVLFFGTGSGFGKEEIKAMLRDGDHPNWRDESFSDYLGKTFEQDDWNAAFWCFEVIGSTLQRLEEELRRFASAVPQQGQVAATAGSTKFSIRETCKRKASHMFTGLAWTTKNPELDVLQEKLREQINDLIQLRVQRDKSKKFRTPKPRSNAVAGITGEIPLSTILEVRASSRRLYDAVRAVKNCPCCSIDLQLPRTIPQGPSSKASTCLGPGDCSTQFNLLIAPVVDKTSFTCIVVLPEKISPMASLSTHTTVMSSTQQPKGSAMKRAPAMGQPPRTPRVHFERADQNQVGILQSWCSLTSLELRIGCALSVPAMESYLSILPNVDSYRHVLQRAVEPPSGSRMSLREVIDLTNSSRQGKMFSWPHKRRYELAYILACSLLHCSDSWFKPGWRSGDINFLIPPDHQISDEAMKLPYVSSAPMISSPIESGTEIVKNNHLFSLAVALIEIGYGDSIFNLCEGLEQGTHLDLYKEFAGAKKLAKGISDVMGRRYAKVVLRCLWCDFGLVDHDDLEYTDMQEGFYRNVICELQKCLQTFIFGNRV